MKIEMILPFRHKIFLFQILFLALIGSLTFGSTLCCSPIAGILVDKIGIRLTVFIGGAVATASLFVSSFVTDQVIEMKIE